MKWLIRLLLLFMLQSCDRNFVPQFELNSTECDDNDSCTLDVLRWEVNEEEFYFWCVYYQYNDCCQEDTIWVDFCKGVVCDSINVGKSCDDGDPCTDDYCYPYNQICRHFPVIGCSNKADIFSEQWIEVAVYNMYGQEVTRLTDVQSHSVNNVLAKGIYVLKIRTESGIFNRTIINL